MATRVINLFKSRWFQDILYADQIGVNGRTSIKLYEYSNVILGAVAPVAFFSSPGNPALGAFCEPILEIVLPIHTHIGLNIVAADYVPKHYQVLARSSIIGLNVLLIYAFLKIQGQYSLGIVELIKYLWIDKKFWRLHAEAKPGDKER